MTKQELIEVLSGPEFRAAVVSAVVAADEAKAAHVPRPSAGAPSPY